MKKIAIVINNLMMGGIQKALINLLNEIEDFYDIDLILFSHQGDLIEKVPPKINILDENKYLKYLGVEQSKASIYGNKFYYFRFLLMILNRIFGSKSIRKRLINKARVKGNYDVAISFTQNYGYKVLSSGCNEFVLNNINSNMKISFIHGDFDRLDCNNKYDNHLYSKFDKIACVSESTREIFLKTNSLLREKTFTVKNCTNYNEIINLANEEDIKIDNGFVNIITVARISQEKGLVRAFYIIKRLISENYRIKWYIIGDGPQKGIINNLIIESHLSENIILVGNQLNPYKYMRKMSLFLLPSEHEAAPMVFNECKALNLPILTTNTSSAMELVENEKIGWVCDNDDLSIYKNLKRIIDKGLHLGLVEFYDVNNALELEQFKTLIGD